jgi:hypothetical protein
LNAGSRSDRFVNGITGLDFTDATEGGAGGSFGGPDRVSIAGGAVEGGIFAVAANFFGKDETESVGDRERENGARTKMLARLRDDQVASFREGQHNAPGCDFDILSFLKGGDSYWLTR